MSAPNGEAPMLDTTGLLENQAATYQSNLDRNSIAHKRNAQEPAVYFIVNKPVSVSVFSRGTPLGKRITRNADGTISKAVHAQLYEGAARVESVDGLTSFAALRARLSNCEALAYGTPSSSPARVVTKKAIARGGQAEGTIARSADYVKYSEGPAIGMVDNDPRPGADALSPEALRETLCAAVPGLDMATMLWSPSTSSCIYDSDTGEEVVGVRGQRLYLIVNQGTLLPDLGALIFDRLLLAGHGYTRFAGDGKPLVRTIVDESVYQAERLDFVRADCGAGLVQRPAASRIFESANGLGVIGESGLNVDALPPLTAAERARVKQIKDQLTKSPAVLAESARIHAEWAIKNARTANPEGSDADIAAAAAGYSKRAQGHIAGDFPITLSDGAVVTVDDVLAAPDIYNGRECADPADGGTDLRVGVLMLKRNNGGSPAIWSHLHGGRWFDMVSLRDFDDVAVRDDERRDSQKAENVRMQMAPISTLPPIMTTQQMLEDCVWIAKGREVGRLSDPRHVLSFQDFAGLTAASTTEITPKGAPKSNDPPRVIPNATLWKNSEDRKTVLGRTFHPGAGEFCRDPNGQTALNSWRPIERRPASVGVEPFLDQVAYLVPESTEREAFLDWLAHIEQRPGELPHYGWLHIAAETGTGRNWLASLLARVWRGYVAPNVDLPSLLASQFNDEIGGRILAIVDEVQEGGGENPHRQANRLKSIVNAEFRKINGKHERQYLEHNACRWLTFSNHDNALPINNNDRRWYVVRHSAKPRPASDYRALYALLPETDFVNAVGVYLRERNISRFNPGERPPMTEAKRAAVAASKSLIQQYAEGLVAEWPSDIITNHAVAKSLSDGATDALSSAHRRALDELKCVSLEKPLKIDGVARRCWVLRHQDKWEGADPAAMVAEVRRAYSAERVDLFD